MKSVELFAGAGGLALGSEKAGFKVSALVEWDKWACQTLRKNRPNWNVLEFDIQKIKSSDIISKKTDIDLLTGGYPCQSFSEAGTRRGLSDIRGTLFYDFARLIGDMQPKIFLGENVRGLMSHDKGKTFQIMLDILDGLNYKIYHKIINSVDYGVPQKRQRVFIVGIKNSIHKKDFVFPKYSGAIVTLREALKNVPDSEGSKYSESKAKVLAQVSPGGCWRDLPKSVAKDYMKSCYFMSGGRTGIARRLSWDEPSLTLLCSPGQKQTERCHPEEVRPFTIRESARIQTFPDDWVFEGSVAQQYKQIGNAVPVKLSELLCKSIKDYLE